MSAEERVELMKAASEARSGYKPEAVSLAHFRSLCEEVAGARLPDFFARPELRRTP